MQKSYCFLQYIRGGPGVYIFPADGPWEIRKMVRRMALAGIQNAIDAGCDVILHGADIDPTALEGIAFKGLIYMPTPYITSEHIWGSGNLPEHMTSRMKAACKPHREGVVRARELGTTIATGTDGGPKPGALMHEICELVGCGFTPQEAVVSATRNTAEALGVGERLGTLEPGKPADCIVIEGDPLADISILTAQDSIAMVIKSGRVEVDQLTAETART
jgi:imidazolonepropionase-like amidohydrolase